MKNDAHDLLLITATIFHHASSCVSLNIALSTFMNLIYCLQFHLIEVQQAISNPVNSHTELYIDFTDDFPGHIIGSWTGKRDEYKNINQPESKYQNKTKQNIKRVHILRGIFNTATLRVFYIKFYSLIHIISTVPSALQRRHNEHDLVSNRRCPDCLLNALFRRRSQKCQSSASWVFLWGIHRRPMESTHKRPVTRKMYVIV